MEPIVRWLMGVESKAEQVYRAAAERLRDAVDLHGRLLKLAEEERGHLRMMSEVDSCLQSASQKPKTAFILDRETMDRIETYFLDCEKRLATDAFQEQDILACIAKTEFSEWNDLFTYALGSLKQAGREFEHVAAMVQRHRADIEELLASRGFENVGMIRQLPSLWRTRILVVDDNADIREMLKMVLEPEGEVETAEDGKRGLQKLTQGYFDLVISDLSMPNMGGIEFYTASRERFPSVAGKFIFFAGDLSPEDEAFFDRTGLPLLLKPASIRELRYAVREMIRSGGADSPSVPPPA